MGDRPATIRDIAQAAGVSIATVSHAFNLTGQITDETRRRVLAVARKLRYHPNGHARTLAAGSSRTLGIIVSDIENPFFSVVIRSFEQRARHWGCDVIVGETNYDVALMRRSAERMIEQKVRGVAIMTSEMSPQWLQAIVGRGIPVACFDLDLASKRATNLKVNYLSGMRQVIDHLYHLGHRHIAFVGGRPAFKNIMSRQKSYVECMQALRLEPGPIVLANQRLDGGYEAGLKILSISPRPTAIVAVNDLTAIGVIKAYADHGLRVPDDLSIVGFDNTYLAAYFVPRLTTVDMHPDVVGRMAADALHETWTDPKAGGKQYPIDIDLVIGASTGRLASALVTSAAS